MKRTLTSFTFALALRCTGAAFAQQSQSDDTGAVFLMTNAADKNQIIAYDRAADGTLKEVFKFDTGGRGSGGLVDPLESQGSLILSRDHGLLFAVNAGSGSISVFVWNAPALTSLMWSTRAEANQMRWRNTMILCMC
jgi:hypothetical protein